MAADGKNVYLVKLGPKSFGDGPQDICKDDNLNTDKVCNSANPNLVPRVSLLCLPWSLEERPWLRLVTCQAVTQTFPSG